MEVGVGVSEPLDQALGDELSDGLRHVVGVVKIVEGDAEKTLALGEARGVWALKEVGVFSKTVLKCGHLCSSRGSCRWTS